MLKRKLAPALFLIFALITAQAAAAQSTEAPKSGRAAYADYLSEKLAFIAKARADLVALGYSGKGYWGSEIPADEQFEFMWATRSSASVQKKIMEIVSDPTVKVEDRSQKFSNLAEALYNVSRFGPMRALERKFLESQRDEGESDAAFAALLEYDEARADFLVFMANLVDSLEYSLDDKWLRLPLDEDALDFLWQARPTPEELKALGELIRKEGQRGSYGKNDVAAMLKGPEAYRQSKFLKDHINNFFFRVRRGEDVIIAVAVTQNIKEELLAPGLAPYQPVKGYVKPESFPAMQGKLPSGVNARRLDLLSIFNKGEALPFLGNEPAYALFFDDFRYSVNYFEDEEEKVRWPILAGTPMEAFAQSGFRLGSLADMERRRQRAALANEQEGGRNLGFLAVSDAPLEELAAHLGWLHLVHFEYAAADGEAAAEPLPYSAFHYLNEPAPCFAWLAAYADEASLDALFGPMKRVYIYWPGEDTTKPWVELSREGAASPARRLGKDAILHFGIAEREEFIVPFGVLLMRPRALETIMGYLNDKNVQKEFAPLAQLSEAQRREVAGKVLDLHEELDAQLRESLPARDILAGWLILGMKDEAFTEMRAVLLVEAETARERVRKFYDWLESIYMETRKDDEGDRAN